RPARDATSARVLELLGEFARVEGVHGNMDDPELRATLPEQLVVEVGGSRIGMLHIPGPAAGRAERLAERFRGCDAVVYGHTHMPEAGQHDGVWLLNPGSPTQRHRAPTRSLLTLEIVAGAITPTLVPLP